MKNPVRKIFLALALFATIFSASSASATEISLSDVEFATFAAELQKNLFDKSLQINDLKRTPEKDIKPDKKNKIKTYTWQANLVSKESSADVATVNFATDSDNQVAFISLGIKSGANQEITCNDFWDAALTALNFTEDERNKLLKGGTTNKDGIYNSKFQRSQKEKFSFAFGILPTNKTLFSTFSRN